MRRAKGVALAALLFSLLLPFPLAAQVRDIGLSPSPTWRGQGTYTNSWAVLVGVNRYRSPGIPRLQYAESDASSMREALLRLGFPAGNIRLLLGTKATRDEVIRVLEEDLNPRMGAGDRLFFYFAGHGVTTEVHGARSGHLLTHDSVVYDWPTRERPFMRQAPARALDMRTLMAKVKTLNPRHKMLAVDSCFSGYAAGTRDIGVVGTSPGASPARLSRWLGEPAIQVLTAGRAGQRATEKDEYGHGVFTHYLLKGLAGGADEAGGGPDGLLTFDELAAYVRNRVSREPDVDQDPQAAEVGEGQFVFVLPGAPAPGVAPPGVESPEAARLREEAERLRREREPLEAEKKRSVEEGEQLRFASIRDSLLARFPRSFSKMLSDPQFQGLPPAEKHKVREAFFNRFIAKDAGFLALPREDQERIRESVVGPPMVEIPAGWFVMGSEEGEGEPGERPRRRVYLDAFWIDKYEVTNEWYGEFVKAAGRRAPLFWDDSRFNDPQQPVMGVTWDDAVAFCNWLGRRLPTEAEWEKAARGTDGRKYPWGDGWDPNKAIWGGGSDGTHPVDRTYNTHQSPYGAVDMAGNVWQWVADWYDGNYYQRAPERNPKGPESGTRRVLRGGSWDSLVPGTLRAAYRTRSFPVSWANFGGFRCARAP